MPDTRPLVYSCSGCSNVAQIANDVALALDARKIAQMSCIVGVGGGVAPLLRLARSGRQIIALDGCALQCVKHCLGNQGLEPHLHYVLTDEGFRKRAYSKALPKTIGDMCQKIIDTLSPNRIPITMID